VPNGSEADNVECTSRYCFMHNLRWSWVPSS
jgi:hypothetical protein